MSATVPQMKNRMMGDHLSILRNVEAGRRFDLRRPAERKSYRTLFRWGAIEVVGDALALTDIGRALLT